MKFNKTLRYGLYTTLVLLSVLWIAGCCVNDPQEEIHDTRYVVKRTFSYQIEAGRKTKLRLDGASGDVLITGTSNDSVVFISGERKVGSNSERDADDHLDELQVSVSEIGNDLYVETEQPEKTHGRNYTVNYNIQVPVNWQVEAGNVNGTVQVRSVENRVKIDVVNGTVQATDIYGDLDVDVTNGRVDSRVELPQDGTCDIKTTNGEIALQIPGSTSAAFTATVTNGGVDMNGLTLKNMNSSRQKVQGILGGGNGEIRLSTTNGNITVNGY